MIILYRIFVLLSTLLSFSHSLDNGLLRKPPLGFNSWTAFGTGVSEADLKSTADFFISSGLAAAGYLYVNSDDGYITYDRDTVTGRLVPDPVKFPSGLRSLADYIHSKGLLFGIYTASSSVVCSGRPGTLFHEAIDAQTFVDWDVDYVKIDLCGEYGYGNQARYSVFADAINATGKSIAISTEPYDIIPNPSVATYSNVWRCCSDIDAQWNVIVDRIDRNDVLAPFVGPGAWSDADMLQIGNGALTIQEQRAHFALWCVTKNPLLLATDITRLSPAQLGLIKTPGLIKVNQDDLGIPARKMFINGLAPLRHVGLVPCEAASNSNARANVINGTSLLWDVRPLAPVNGTTAFSIYNKGAARCLALAHYAGVDKRPVLQPCNTSDSTQSWALPIGVGHLGAILSLTENGGALAPANSTLYSSIHGSDPIAVADAAYGLTNLGLVPFTPEPPCNSRDCAGYSPTQTWYWSPRSGLIALAVYSANHYHCYDPPCEFAAAAVPAPSALCLSHVLSVAYAGTDPTDESTSIADIWGGPLANEEFVVLLHNRASTTANVSTSFNMLGLEDQMCVEDLFTGNNEGPLSGGITRELEAHDVAAFRLSSTPC